jgi:two-component system, NarL family, nitrate/nitrite response regulator NarL
MTALPAPGAGHGMRLVLCDDHVLFVEPLAAALRIHGYDAVVATRPAEVVPLVGAHVPDLCLVDLHFPDGDGVQLIAALRQRYPALPVVVLSASAEPREGAAAIRAGATGILRKDQPISAIFDAIERVSRGRRPDSPPAPRPSAATPERSQVSARIDQLTERERDVLRRLVLGEDTVAIARTLRIAVSTARTHLQNVLLKLGVHSRLQAVALVVGAGLEDEL